MRIAAAILAAGFSSRMGSFKPLMELGGVSLLARCTLLFRQASVDEIVVVTGHRHAEIEAEAQHLSLCCIHNPHFAEGMLTSAQQAAQHLTDCDGFFLLPVDIPLVRPATVRVLLTRFNGLRTLVPSYDGATGHPPLIAASLIPQILDYHGTGGLKELLAVAPSEPIPVWDRGILLDADTNDDFHTLTQKYQRIEIGETEEAMILARQEMPEKGVRHGMAVAEIALAIGRALNQHDSHLDEELLYNAALLHDIGKGRKNHEQAGADLLVACGLGDLAPIVAAHRGVPLPASGGLTEKEVVCLADKLVRGTLRLPVAQRFQEKLAIYADDPEAIAAIRRYQAQAVALQKRVENITGKSIDTLLGAS